jgi:hypothetical protein
MYLSAVYYAVNGIKLAYSEGNNANKTAALVFKLHICFQDSWTASKQKGSKKKIMLFNA